ncbi:unnamed protein product [Amoebophrya sp. A120]|nr:unnamed protein product [Amoebophrya sp. A120]|eukprot:GSA120T00025621001.1
MVRNSMAVMFLSFSSICSPLRVVAPTIFRSVLAIGMAMLYNPFTGFVATTASTMQDARTPMQSAATAPFHTAPHRGFGPLDHRSGDGFRLQAEESRAGNQHSESSSCSSTSTQHSHPPPPQQHVNPAHQEKPDDPRNFPLFPRLREQYLAQHCLTVEKQLLGEPNLLTPAHLWAQSFMGASTTLQASPKDLAEVKSLGRKLQVACEALEQRKQQGLALVSTGCSKRKRAAGATGVGEEEELAQEEAAEPSSTPDAVVQEGLPVHAQSTTVGGSSSSWSTSALENDKSSASSSSCCPAPCRTTTTAIDDGLSTLQNNINSALLPQKNQFRKTRLELAQKKLAQWQLYRDKALQTLLSAIEKRNAAREKLFLINRMKMNEENLHPADHLPFLRFNADSGEQRYLASRAGAGGHQHLLQTNTNMNLPSSSSSSSDAELQQKHFNNQRLEFLHRPLLVRMSLSYHQADIDRRQEELAELDRKLKILETQLHSAEVQDPIGTAFWQVVCLCRSDLGKSGYEGELAAEVLEFLCCQEENNENAIVGEERRRPGGCDDTSAHHAAVIVNPENNYAAVGAAVPMEDE